MTTIEDQMLAAQKQDPQVFVLREGINSVYHDANMWIVIVDRVGFVTGTVTDDVKVHLAYGEPADVKDRDMVVLPNKGVDLRNLMALGLHMLYKKAGMIHDLNNLPKFLERAGIPAVGGPLDDDLRQRLALITSGLYGAAWMGGHKAIDQVLKALGKEASDRVS